MEQLISASGSERQNVKNSGRHGRAALPLAFDVFGIPGVMMWDCRDVSKKPCKRNGTQSHGKLQPSFLWLKNPSFFFHVSFFGWFQRRGILWFSVWAATIDSLPNPNLSRSFYDLRHIQVDRLMASWLFQPFRCNPNQEEHLPWKWKIGKLQLQRPSFLL